MTDIETLEAVAKLIKAQGGEEFCRGYIEAFKGGLYGRPSLIEYADYLRGYLSAADRYQLDFIAKRSLPTKDFTDCRNETVKREILRLVD